MTPGTNSALYVALGSVVTIIAVAAGVRAVSPPPDRAAEAGSHRPLLSMNAQGGMQPGTPPGAAYRVEEAVPIQVGGQTGLAVRFSGDGLDAAGKDAAARDIFRRMKDDAEQAGVQLLVISYGASIPTGGEKPKPEDSFLFMRQPDGTWARLRTDGDGDSFAGSGSSAVPALPVPSAAPPVPSAAPPK